ncbi:hypothetical protein [Nesterenkonia sp. PF2B19]|uniref:hypothetical protein n=1 Tax=unclassified Nesterenkonia TaxID=2629769 RepID=UPI000871B9DB|nr:hypothetical protein [Nesterenkonia sp. PF2B19]OSM42238.1 hypothetical protein BCY76_015660 [Nesterenkonia sp. PF2B19]
MSTARPDEPVPPDATESADSPASSASAASPASPGSAASPMPGAEVEAARASSARGFLAEYRWGLGVIGGLGLLLLLLVLGLILTANPHGGTPTDEGDGRGTAGEDRATGPLGGEARPEKSGHEDLLPAGGEAFSDGEGLVVGEDILPGTYRQDPGSGPEDAVCFYVIYADVGESTVRRTGADDRGIAVLEEGEILDSVDCGDWLPLEDTFPERPADEFGTGMHVVGEHVEPGTYELEWDEDTMLCWWDVFRDLRGDGHTLDSGFVPRDDPEFGEPLRITLVDHEQLVVNSEACGTWTKVS